jgi:hypothetical protein
VKVYYCAHCNKLWSFTYPDTHIAVGILECNCGFGTLAVRTVVVNGEALVVWGDFPT